MISKKYSFYFCMVGLAFWGMVIHSKNNEFAPAEKEIEDIYSALDVCLKNSGSSVEECCNLVNRLSRFNLLQWGAKEDYFAQLFTEKIKSLTSSLVYSPPAQTSKFIIYKFLKPLTQIKALSQDMKNNFLLKICLRLLFKDVSSTPQVMSVGHKKIWAQALLHLPEFEDHFKGFQITFPLKKFYTNQGVAVFLNKYSKGLDAYSEEQGIQKGIDPNLTNAFQTDPYYCAALKENSLIISLLKGMQIPEVKYRYSNSKATPYQILFLQDKKKQAYLIGPQAPTRVVEVMPPLEHS